MGDYKKLLLFNKDLVIKILARRHIKNYLQAYINTLRTNFDMGNIVQNLYN